MPESNGDRFVTHSRLHDKMDEAYEAIDEVREVQNEQGKELAKHGVYLKILLVVSPAVGVFGNDIASALTR